ncbi:MAG: thioredoxin family protein [Saprospiraceae bacterium]|nr:thioredoxin family protein [Saprospiraceae bacterium]
MKKIISFSLFALLSFSVFCQTDDYEAENKGWLVDIDKAFAESKNSGKPILANFTGSDWCGWCKRLTASVFSKKEFQTWAKDNVVLLELDFPKRKQLPEKYQKQNAQLKNAFKITAYPTVWVFNLDKDEKGNFSIEGLGKTGYTKTAQKFTSDVDQMIERGEKNKTKEGEGK